MTPTFSHTQTHAAAQVDVLLQDSYLLVVEIQQKGSAQNSKVLWERCAQQIVHVRERLQEMDLSPRSIEHIGHAQCALLDETVLSHTQEDAHAEWASKPLQAQFFGRHQAGEFLYEEMRAVLREPAPELHVLTVYQRVLMLGFRGRYRDLEDPEREQLLQALSVQVPPLQLHGALATRADAGGWLLGRMRSARVHAVAVALLLIGAWWGLDHLLDGLVATFLRGQA